MSVYKKEENNHLLNLIEMRFGGYWNLDRILGLQHYKLNFVRKNYFKPLYIFIKQDTIFLSTFNINN